MHSARALHLHAHPILRPIAAYAAPPKLERTVPRVTEAISHAFIADGRLSSTGAFIGTYTSQLQEFIDRSFAPVSAANYSALSLVNSSSLNTLNLSGAYECDVPLRLPSMFVLRGSGLTLTPAANLSLANLPRFTAMVMLDHVSLSAVVGGVYDAGAVSGAKDAVKDQVQDAKAAVKSKVPPVPQLPAATVLQPQSMNGPIV